MRIDIDAKPMKSNNKKKKVCTIHFESLQEKYLLAISAGTCPPQYNIHTSSPDNRKNTLTGVKVLLQEGDEGTLKFL